ncbi:cytosolic protein (plasmid) [Pedobacter sp. BS3]|uniref:PmeII family type II restriction endonuclease n=1 Tax=Pedobacter sp. BS3 TaxID=2567937 RepID=UPI0011EC52A3|nr:PmeII family type II restriction endonuclease [Pedobacter sp. BS3]TZF86123.1 cytosolic protein [Pedobacter sp. BS3]
MNQLSITDVSQYVEDNIGTFHQKRIEGLTKLKLNRVLGKKNPYLFKAKFVLTAQEIIKSFTDAFISSQEETIFGDWLEGLAIFINTRVYNGWKSGIPGIDLEFDNNGARHIVTIKSGPNWGNSSQIGKMIADFKTAKKTLRTSNSQINVVAVNGCCYGKDNQPDKGDYFKYCGQRFWAFISGDHELYTKIIEPLGHQAKERNDEFIISYSKMINRFTKEFADTFCLTDGSIDWDKLVRFNSSASG